MKVLAIDPGTVQSGFVVYDGTAVLDQGVKPNDDMRERISEGNETAIVLEKVASYGMSVGESVFQTVFEAGRFFEVAVRRGIVPHRMVRSVVKMHLCHSMKAKDSNIRQALIDRFGGETAIGKKASPGPLYGIKSHEWAALALAVTWWDRENF